MNVYRNLTKIACICHQEFLKCQNEVSSSRVVALLPRCCSSTSNAIRPRKDVLILSDIYPQPSASAAGVRTSYFIRRLSRDATWGNIHYAAASSSWDGSEREELERDYGVTFHSILPNRSTEMETLLDLIGREHLALVIFDRFYAEEKFSFQIRLHCPDAVRVVDMQDFHALRRARQALVKAHDKSNPGHNDPFKCVVETLSHRPSSQDPLLLRELASLHRSDLTLVCSPMEYDLLKDVYRIPASKLSLASFWINSTRNSSSRFSFHERRDFCVLGGFRHPPNVDAVLQLTNCIWPWIRKALPEASLHVYGAYAPPSIKTLQDASAGLLVHGFVPTLQEALQDKRVLLAPLRYGAGIKGKIIEAWTFGLPVVCTPIGSEGMSDERPSEWGGMIADSTDDFVEKAVELYSHHDTWNDCVRRGRTILQDLYDEDHWDGVTATLHSAIDLRRKNRNDDYIGAILWEQSTRSTEYFSRWIECKESRYPDASIGRGPSKETS